MDSEQSQKEQPAFDPSRLQYQKVRFSIGSLVFWVTVICLGLALGNAGAGLLLLWYGEN